MERGKYNITKQEIESIKAYMGNSHISINSMLETGLDNEVRINDSLEYIPLTEKDVKRYIKDISNIYSAMLKYKEYNNNSPKTIYRGTNKEEVTKMKNTKKYNRVCSTTKDEERAKGYFTNAYKDKAVLNISISENVPYLDVQDVLSDYGNNWEKEIIVAPFTKVTKIEESGYEKYRYNVKLEKIQLEKEPSREEKVYKDTEKANQDLKEYFKLRKEINSMYDKKDHLLKKVLNSGMIKDMSDKRAVYEDVQKLEKDIEVNSNKANKLEVSYSSWKRELISLIKTNLKEVEHSFEKEKQEKIAKIESEKKEREKIEKEKREKEIKLKEEAERKKIKEQLEYTNNSQKTSNINKEEKYMLDALKEVAISENLKSTSKVNGLRNKLNNLDKRQKTFEEYAKKLGIKYNKRIDVIDAKEAIYGLEEKIEKINKKVEKYDVNSDKKTYSQKEKEITLYKDLEKEVNSYIDTVVSKDINMSSQEEINELKKGIYQKVTKIKCKMDLKDLTKQKNKIVKKSVVTKFVNKLTGKAKKDEIALESIDTKISAINTKLKNVNSEDKKSYSMHEAVSILEEYNNKNLKKKDCKKDCGEIQKLNEGIRGIFKIEENKLEVEKQKRLDKEIYNLPTVIKGRKLSNEEIERWKTNEWIKKNGYQYVEKKESNIIHNKKSSIVNSCKLLSDHIESKLKNEIENKDIYKNKELSTKEDR